MSAMTQAVMPGSYFMRSLFGHMAVFAANVLQEFQLMQIIRCKLVKSKIVLQSHSYDPGLTQVNHFKQRLENIFNHIHRNHSPVNDIITLFTTYTHIVLLGKICQEKQKEKNLNEFRKKNTAILKVLNQIQVALPIFTKLRKQKILLKNV